MGSLVPAGMAVAEEAAAVAGFPSGFLWPLLVLWCWVPTTDLIVEMEGKNQTVLLNDNATIPCDVPGSTPLNITIMGVTWYRKHQAYEQKVFEMYGDPNPKEVSRPGASVSREALEKGDASLHLPGVQLSDAGEYRCKVVVTPYEVQATVFLKVLGECLRQCPVVPMVMGLGVEMWPRQVEKFGHGPWSWIDTGLCLDNLERIINQAEPQCPFL
ncbi:natural cytotoxicity triggering receptor 3 ligand 1-like [Myotis myotis]|uniref:natural cytotoxicity triggering receptor 3 ligand 1-like n=1 Tax=Myotis myotis TaxID=51298 RepID=UPI00174C014E|nr:natural cytotoxicity triggering receptor 3 ligand 1-like [Myotis myotis]